MTKEFKVKASPRKPGRSPQANFRLPAELVRKVRLEAADRRVYPSQVIAERLAESYGRKPLNIAI